MVKAALDGRGRQEVQLPVVFPPKLLLKPAPRPAGRLPTPIHPPVNPAASVDEKATVRAARRLNRAAAVLAFSVLADSAVEHYRGSFKNKAMYTPLAAVDRGARDQHPWHRRSAVRSRTACGTPFTPSQRATGVIGSGFHLYNVTKKTGGLNWQNLFYGAPLGAPFAILLAGLLGFCSERVRAAPPGVTPKILGFRPDAPWRPMELFGLLGTTGEAGLLHFRGAFHNPLMLLPVTFRRRARH